MPSCAALELTTEMQKPTLDAEMGFQREARGRIRCARVIVETNYNALTYHGGCARTSSPVAAQTLHHLGCHRPWDRRSQSVAFVL